MLTDASSSLHPKVIMPVIRTLFDAETSHRLAINFMKYGGPFGSKDPKKDTENLEVEVSFEENESRGRGLKADRLCCCCFVDSCLDKFSPTLWE